MDNLQVDAEYRFMVKVSTPTTAKMYGLHGREGGEPIQFMADFDTIHILDYVGFCDAEDAKPPSVSLMKGEETPTSYVITGDFTIVYGSTSKWSVNIKSLRLTSPRDKQQWDI